MHKALSRYTIIIAVLLMLPTAIILSGCNRDQATTSETVSEATSELAQNNESPENQQAGEDTSSTTSPAEEDSSQSQASDETNNGEKASQTKGGNPVVIIKTTKGDIKVELDKENAPISTDNFLAYVEDGYYDWTIFHRVIKGFMVQGGGFTADGQQKPTNAPIKNEADNGLKNDRGTIAMARTQVVDSATSQFYINVVDNDFLNHGIRDYGYAVFGKVVEGMDVVDAIADAPTGPGDVPNEKIVIETVEIVQ